MAAAADQVLGSDHDGAGWEVQDAPQQEPGSGALGPESPSGYEVNGVVFPALPLLWKI